MSFPRYGRVLFSATLVRGHIAKFHVPYLKWFKDQGWETWVAAKNDYPNESCIIPYCDHFVNVDFARKPFSKQTFVAYRSIISELYLFRLYGVRGCKQLIKEIFLALCFIVLQGVVDQPLLFLAALAIYYIFSWREIRLLVRVVGSRRR